MEEKKDRKSIQERQQGEKQSVKAGQDREGQGVRYCFSVGVDSYTALPTIINTNGTKRSIQLHLYVCVAVYVANSRGHDPTLFALIFISSTQTTYAYIINLII